MNNVFRDATKCDAPDLIRIADASAAAQDEFIYAAPESVRVLWGWLEKTGVALYAVVRMSAAPSAQFFAKIADVLRVGAVGVILDVGNPDAMVQAASDLFFIREDLFFGRKLFFGLDLEKIEPDVWTDVWFNVKKTNAHGIAFNVPADFVGGVFALFDSMPADFAGELHFRIADRKMATDIIRMFEKMRGSDAAVKLYFII
ncbi:MAG: hypothetical protein LBR41_01425 [Rickettsiales bacterium]|nr:hypothetical protein [Rickettsiales bacterium]